MLHYRPYRCLYLPVVFLLLFACSSSLSPEELLARAQLALAEGDYKAAEIDVKSVLQASPDNARARELYGALYRRQLNPSAAVGEFERSLASREQSETRIQLAKALIESGESEKLLSDWRSGIYVIVEPLAEFRAAVARALAAQGDMDAARAALSRALESGAPSDYVALTQAVFLMRLDQDRQGAARIAREVSERNPGSDEAWSLLGAIAIADEDFASAELFYSKAAKANPYRLDARIQRVSAQLRQGKDEDADRGLRALEDMLPRNPEVAYLRGQWLFNQGRFVDARDKLSIVLNSNPDHAGSLLLSANANLREGNLTTAESQLGRFLALQPDNVTAGLQLASVWRELGEPEKSERLARRILEKDAMNSQALGVLALALASQGQHAESANVFGELAALQPDVASIRIAAGSQQLVAGDSQAALEQLEAAVALDPNSVTARERLIEAQIVRKDLNAALAAADAYVARAPEAPRAAVYRGRVRLQQRDEAGAREEFLRALDLEPGHIEASGAIAALEILNDNMGAAISAFRSALAEHPGDLLTSMNLAVLLERSGDLEGMVSVLQTAAEANADAPPPRIALARYALNRSEPQSAIQWLEPLADAQGGDYRVAQLLAQAYLLAEQPELASRSARRLLEQRPDDAQTLALVARVDNANKRPGRAQKHLERALELDAESVDLRKQLVETLLLQRKLDEAEVAIEKLPAEVKEEPALLSVRGRLALARRDLPVARDLLAAAFEKQRNNVNLLLLTGVRWQLGERDSVLQELGSWLDEHPKDIVARIDLAARLLAGGDSAAARGHYVIIVEQQPDNAIALNNLAWLLREQAPDRALLYVRRAAELVPGNPQILDTYAMVELAAGNAEAALTRVDEALIVVPEDNAVRYRRAQILVELNRDDEALSLLRELADEPDFAFREEALALLESLGG